MYREPFEKQFGSYSSAQVFQVGTLDAHNVPSRAVTITLKRLTRCYYAMCCLWYSCYWWTSYTSVFWEVGFVGTSGNRFHHTDM